MEKTVKIISRFALLGLVLIASRYMYKRWNGYDKKRRQASSSSASSSSSSSPVQCTDTSTIYQRASTGTTDTANQLVPSPPHPLASSQVRYDIILLYADDDHTLAVEVQQALMNNVQVQNLTVELYDEVGLGESTMQHLFDKGNLLFVLLSQNYNRDRFISFKGQLNLVHTLCDEDARSRIIPVSTERDTAASEFDVIQGVNYHRYKDDPSDKTCFDSIKNLVEKGRRDNHTSYNGYI